MIIKLNYILDIYSMVKKANYNIQLHKKEAQHKYLYQWTL